MWGKIAESFVEWVREGRVGRSIGFACGIMLGVLYLIFGFWDTLVFAFIVFVGYQLGLKSDNREKWLDISAVIRWFSERRFR